MKSKLEKNKQYTVGHLQNDLFWARDRNVKSYSLLVEKAVGLWLDGETAYTTLIPICRLLAEVLDRSNPKSGEHGNV